MRIFVLNIIAYAILWPFLYFAMTSVEGHPYYLALVITFGGTYGFLGSLLAEVLKMKFGDKKE